MPATTQKGAESSPTCAEFICWVLTLSKHPGLLTLVAHIPSTLKFPMPAHCFLKIYTIPFFLSLPSSPSLLSPSSPMRSSRVRKLFLTELHNSAETKLGKIVRKTLLKKKKSPKPYPAEVTMSLAASLSFQWMPLFFFFKSCSQ